MDEIAKTEARNYLSAAGFFILAAVYLMDLFNTSINGLPRNDIVLIIAGTGLILISVLLIILRKRDMIALFFMMLSFCYIAIGFTSAYPTSYALLSFYALIVLTVLITLTGKDKVKWLLVLIPLLMIVNTTVTEIVAHLTIPVFMIIAAVLAIYFALACASERINLPGRKLLTADEDTDFKASGSLLGYLLFAVTSGSYVLYYILGDALVSVDSLRIINIIAAVLMIYTAILLFAVGKMRFTPVMFLLMAIADLLAMYSSGSMFIGCGILFIIIGLFAMLRKESRILPGIMLIIYGCADFFTVYAGGNMPVVSMILNLIPCLIAIYLAFVVYSQKNLPKF